VIGSWLSRAQHMATRKRLSGSFQFPQMPSPSVDNTASWMAQTGLNHRLRKSHSNGSHSSLSPGGRSRAPYLSAGTMLWRYSSLPVPKLSNPLLLLMILDRGKRIFSLPAQQFHRRILYDKPAISQRNSCIASFPPLE